NYVICHNSSLEMLAIKELSNFFANEIQGPKMKQLFVNSIVSEFASCARYFPNLQRLHIERYDRSPFDDEFYVGPVLEKLEILEICFYLDLYGELEHYHGFSLADHCPRLKSAFHYIQTDQDFHVNSGSKSFLRDLVLQLYSRKVTEKSTEYMISTVDVIIVQYHFTTKNGLKYKKWPQLSAKRVRIGRGFDFMKYCFLRNHNRLPILLDPDQ
uniref:Uncharacterized protein n=1 Tax=Tetranychus urticae TaxID=32264 RepID=T1L5E5_TETUR